MFFYRYKLEPCFWKLGKPKSPIKPKSQVQVEFKLDETSLSSVHLNNNTNYMDVGCVLSLDASFLDLVLHNSLWSNRDLMKTGSGIVHNLIHK